MIGRRSYEGRPPRSRLGVWIACATVPLMACDSVDVPPRAQAAEVGAGLAQSDATPAKSSIVRERLLSDASFSELGVAIRSAMDVTSDGRRVLLHSYFADGPRFLDTANGELSMIWDHGDTWSVDAVLSTDDTRIALSLDETDVTVLDVATGDTTRLPNTGSTWSFPMDWSPDDRRLLVLAADENGTAQVLEYDFDTAVYTQILSNTGLDSPRYSPDGRWVVYAGSGVRAVRADGGDDRLIVEPSEVVRDAGIQDILWSPDGRYLLLEVQGWRGEAVLVRQAMAGIEPIGPPEVVERGLWRTRLAGLDGDGALYTSVRTDQQLASFVPLSDAGLPTTRPTVRPSSRPMGADHVQYSPDGRYMALFQTPEPNGGSYSLRGLALESRETGTVTPLDFPADIRWFNKIRWAPEGGHLLLVVTDRMNRRALMRFDYRSQELDTLLAPNDELRRTHMDPVPGRSWIVYTVSDSSGWGLAYLDPDTGEEHTLLEKGALGPGRIGGVRVAPTGDAVAFTRLDELWVLEFDSSRSRLVAQPRGASPLSDPAWHPDGSWLYMNVHNRPERGPHQRIVRVNVRDGAVEELGIAGIGFTDIDISPDGRELSFAEPRNGDTELWRIQGLFGDIAEPASDQREGR